MLVCRAEAWAAGWEVGVSFPEVESRRAGELDVPD